MDSTEAIVHCQLLTNLSQVSISGINFFGFTDIWPKNVDFVFSTCHILLFHIFHFSRVVDKMAPSSAQELLEYVNSGNYFSFTVVRHPFDRLVSAYRDRILHGCTNQAKFFIPQIFKLTRKRQTLQWLWLGIYSFVVILIAVILSFFWFKLNSA